MGVVSAEPKPLRAALPPLRLRAIGAAALAAPALLAALAGCPGTAPTDPDGPEVAETDPAADSGEDAPDAPGTEPRPGGGHPAESDEAEPGEDRPEGSEPGEPDPEFAGDADAEEEAIQPPGTDLTEAEAEEKARAHIRDAEAALRGGAPDLDAAIADAREALALEGDNLRAMLILAWAHYRGENYALAEEVLQEAANRADGEEHPRFHFIRGLLYEARDRDEEAERAYERAVDLAPGYESALLNLGVHYLENRRYPEAIRVYERLTGDLDHDEPAAWANLGSAYRGRASELRGPTGDPDQRAGYLRASRQAYERALELEGEYAPAHYNLGILYLDADPFPDNGGELDTLERLRRAEEHFGKYQEMAGADAARVEEEQEVVQNQIEREERRIERAERRREREREREGR